MTNESAGRAESIQFQVVDRLASRLSKLERAHRRRGWLNVVLMIGFAGSLTVSGAIILDPELVRGLTDIGAEVRASRFVLEDLDGNLRGLWEMSEDGIVRLSIHDAGGHPRMNLSVLADGSPGISFSDATERRRVVLGLLPDKTSTLVFADDAGVPRAVLGVSGQGAANLLFADDKGVSRVSMGLDASGAGNLTLPEVLEEQEEDR